MEKGYKIVREDLARDDIYRSLYVPYPLTYRIGKWTRAPRWAYSRGYGLMYFDTLAEARAWLDSAGKQLYKIFECEVRGMISLYLQPRLEAALVTQETFDGDYFTTRLIKAHDEGQRFPNGTRFAREVKLLREVK